MWVSPYQIIIPGRRIGARIGEGLFNDVIQNSFFIPRGCFHTKNKYFWPKVWKLSKNCLFISLLKTSTPPQMFLHLFSWYHDLNKLDIFDILYVYYGSFDTIYWIYGQMVFWKFFFFFLKNILFHLSSM